MIALIIGMYRCYLPLGTYLRTVVPWMDWIGQAVISSPLNYGLRW